MAYRSLSKDLSDFVSQIHEEEGWKLPDTVQANLHFLQKYGDETTSLVSIRAAVKAIHEWLLRTPVGFFVRARATGSELLRLMDKYVLDLETEDEN